jgi:hypothetical protein
MPATEGSPSKSAKGTIGAILLLVCGVIISQLLRVGLAADVARARTKRDVYALPSPTQARILCLGYRSALAELIFAHVLVDSGIHLQEHRRFDTLAAYLRTIIALDPKYPTPYRMADTLLTFQVGKPSLKNFEDAREIVSAGMRELPYDQELYLTAGQFMAYLAAPHVASLAGPEKAEQWKLDGARALARSCELIGHDENVPYHCITAARLFDGAGQKEAAKRFLQRVLSTNDDESIRKLALDYLGRSLGKEQDPEVEMSFSDLESARKSDLPFISKNKYLLLPPPFDPVACVGRLENSRVACATSLLEWHARKAMTTR